MSTPQNATPMYQPVEAKTADYQIKHEDLGKLFTNRGATGAVIFTLPSVTGLPTGWWCEFFTCVLDQDVTVASQGSNDNLTTFNDLTADSVKLGTASERAGAGVKAIWDGTGWLIFLHTEETQTVTVA